MKITPTLFLLPALAAALHATEAGAQNFAKKYQYTSVGVGLNAMNYFGDVVPQASWSSLRVGATRPNFTVSATQQLTSRLAARAALSYGRITGEDAKAADAHDATAMFRYHRNINFRNDLLELSAVGVFNLVPNHYGYLRRLNLVPYVFGGVALFHHNPKGRVEGGDIPASLREGRYEALQPLRTEGQSKGYTRTQVALPFGVGARYRIDNNLDVSLEIGWRKTFTDYLDDVSTTYTSTANLRSDAARYFGNGVTRTDDGEGFANFTGAGNMRGSSNQKDWYIITGVTLSYILVPSTAGSKFR